MTRWLVLVLGLGIAAGGMYLLASPPNAGRLPSVASEPGREIADSSRSRLERVLREVDGQTGRNRSLR